MDKKFDDLNDTFNVDASIMPVVNKSEITKVEELKNISDDLKKDFEYARGNLYSLIEKGQEIANGILEVAQDSGQPRAYEVAGQVVKNVADTVEKLIDLRKKLKDVDEVQAKGPTTVNNALFVGSTADLAKFLKTNDNEKDFLNSKE
jgi:GTP1/Obg family GTP-binding protein